ncbi:hypothetical protein CK203_114669 [Vitis vinifera]|uniref:Retrovirus-related Pol polyprotein from transposon TNT 1-94 n=1 Tax=Vitis vinifera TaxID=29760 RepID=A0A438FEA3_VITVI|nr:hypothetical protein CK203_114669 [Vitis vinifera]
MKKGCTKFQKWLEKKGYAKPNETNAKFFYVVASEIGTYLYARIKRLVNGVLNTLDFTDFDTCVDCIKGKQTNKSMKGAKRSTNILEIIHSDICCPDIDVYGLKYFISFIDDYSRYCISTYFITRMKHGMPLKFLRLK